MKIPIFSKIKFSSLQSFAQVQYIPAIVKKSFAKNYPNIQKANWEQNSNEDYVAYFINGGPKEAFFKSDGTWLYAFAELELEGLPFKIKKFINDEYHYPEILFASIYEDAVSKHIYKVTIAVKQGPINEENWDNDYRTRFFQLSFDENKTFLEEQEIFPS